MKIFTLLALYVRDTNGNLELQQKVRAWPHLTDRESFCVQYQKQMAW